MCVEHREPAIVRNGFTHYFNVNFEDFKENSMDISTLIQNINEDYLLNCVPLSTLQTANDVNSLPFQSCILITEPEWKARFPKIDAGKMYVTPAHCGTLFYYDADQHILIDAIGLLCNTNPEYEQDRFLQFIQKIKDSIANEDYIKAVLHLDSATMLHVARDIIINRNPTPKLYDFFLNVYTDADAGTNNLPIDVVREIARGKSEEQQGRTEKELSKLPDIIPIYRGMGSASTPLEGAYSWSLSQRVACFFATRFCGDYYRIVSAKVRKEDVIDYYDERNEKEIIALPDAVYDVEVEDFMSAMELIGRDPGPLKTAQPYVEAMDTSPLLTASVADHDIAHAKRVVVMASYIADHEKIRGRYLDTLLTAAQFPDCGRTNSLEDASHGAQSFTKYAARYPEKADDVLNYLMTFHCRDDEEAKVELSRFPETDRPAIWKCLCALKDADALDRVRLGMWGYLDPAFLRFKYSRRLIGVAKELHSKYKL